MPWDDYGQIHEILLQLGRTSVCTYGGEDLPGLGHLEHRVMAALWQGGERSVRDVQEAFAGELAYTTLMTTMDRLFRKGLLARRKRGRAYVYSARVSHGELRQGAARGLLARLLGADRESARPILSSIVESVSERDRDAPRRPGAAGPGPAARAGGGRNGVSELLKGLVLGLVSFLTVSTVASALVAACPWLVPPAGAPAGRRARALFALRLFPSAASLFALFALFVPAYLAHEPRGSGETVGLPLLALALLGCLVLVSAALRGLRAGNETRRLAQAWAEDAEPLDLAVAGMPAYRIAHPFPVVAVLGVRHPRLYVAGQVLSSLGDSELHAVLEHERAHVAARDNLRHWLLRSCPDVLAWTPAGRRLDRAWLAAAEEAADERAARGKPEAALALAEALLRVARLAPAACSAPLPELALHNGDDLARRVRRLVAAPPPPPARSVAPLLAFPLLLGALPFYPAALRVVHALTESLLALLS